MQGNDLSNGTPKTVMVHLDLVTRVEMETSTRFGIFTSEKQVRVIDPLLLNDIYRTSFEIDASLILFSTDGEKVEAWEEKLDQFGANPFRWFETYSSPQEVVAMAPYRPSLVGICDLPDRGLMYGSYYTSFNRLLGR